MPHVFRLGPSVWVVDAWIESDVKGLFDKLLLALEIIYFDHSFIIHSLIQKTFMKHSLYVVLC